MDLEASENRDLILVPPAALDLKNVAAAATPMVATAAAVALPGEATTVTLMVVMATAWGHNRARDSLYAERWCFSLHSASQKVFAANYYS